MGKRDDGLAVGPLHARPRMTIVGPAGERSATSELECPWRRSSRRFRQVQGGNAVCSRIAR
jgi:hypothetical protein